MFILALLFGVVIVEVLFVEYMLSKFTGHSDKNIKEMEEGISTKNKIFIALNDQIISDINVLNYTATRLKENMYSMFIPRRLNQLDILADELNNI